MLGSNNGQVHACVAIDLNTQNDFCCVDGARPVLNAEEQCPALRRVFAWAKRHGTPLISSVESHREREMVQKGHSAFCIDGTPGQNKVEFTLVRSRVVIEFDNTLTIPLDLFSRCQQVVFRQRGQDILGNPKAERFLNQLPTREFIIFGNVLEGSVKTLALGLAAREKNVSVVVEACGHWNQAAADLSHRQLLAKNVNIITIDELVTRKGSQRKRFPRPSDNGNAAENYRNGNSQHFASERVLTRSSRETTKTIDKLPSHRRTGNISGPYDG